jgi:hypothetical protein
MSAASFPDRAIQTLDIFNVMLLAEKTEVLLTKNVEHMFKLRGVKQN